MSIRLTIWERGLLLNIAIPITSQTMDSRGAYATKCHRIREGKGLLNESVRKEVGKTLNFIGSSNIDNAEGLGKFHLKRVPR
jgi:hypothetical protein